MCNGIGVPASGEHGNRYHAANRLAEAALFADGVHGFPQQVLVREVLDLTAVAGTFDDFAPETLNSAGSLSRKRFRLDKGSVSVLR
jgi:hypothetical protein